MTKPVLIIVHQEQSSPGRVGQALVRRGFPLDIRRPRFGDPLPETLEHHTGAVIFGGPMSANDPDDFVRQEIDWIGVPLKERKPFLGICLGAQMMAMHLGAKVESDHQGRAEIGYYPLSPAPNAHHLFPWPSHVYQWHREGFDLPHGAELLATGPVYPNQAMQYGPTAFGIQFHPELTLAMMHRWTVKGAERFVLPGAQGRKAHFEGRARYDTAVRRWLEAFINGWLVSGHGAPAANAESAGAAPRLARAAAAGS